MLQKKKKENPSPLGPFFSRRLSAQAFQCVILSAEIIQHIFLADKCKSWCCAGYCRAVSRLSRKDEVNTQVLPGFVCRRYRSCKAENGSSEAVTPTMIWKLGCSGRLLSHKALPGLRGAGSRLLTAGRDACSSGGMIFLLNDMQIRVSVSINQF